ncbi:vWA domain-containing protein [Pleionea sp. CnH1-48]|uniref:VWA domain-containing protein n=1 Tax=Pleionea sp. CnH1-48 TaxID=2954494 RepID=UPI0020984F3F|nr:vWA domain-containing protein [Pleionea sp. CnH1-48]MCO7227270.1 VWA domain-containing protein [Pleionea sp. CnH1-48]
MNRKWLLLLLVSVMCLPFSAIAADKPSDQKRSDVRLIIDISGSMKKNDPNNLRIPALRLVTNLMPKESDSGVWTFGRYVNMLVPLKRVDAKWQEQANAAAGKVNSAGLFTNIGDAMTKSTWDWNRPDPAESRSMILLTDGMVDISKDPKKNAAERERILTKVLPKLKNAGVTIHTIALSQEADAELLSTLSNETDGWFRQVNSADELQRIFLKIFEQATPRDSLPLENNQFKVDASIEEMTLLIFRKADSAPAKLTTPSNQSIDASSKDKNVRWFASKAYDLVTITQPEVGDWQINAAVDPDNRVMVVSNLGLSIDELPNNVLANEQIRYRLSLLEEGEVIKKPDFLKLIDAKLQLKSNQLNSMSPLLLDSGSGLFQQIFFAGQEDGVLNIQLVVKSPTFERSRSHAINVYGSPVKALFVPSMIEGEEHSVEVDVAEEVLDLATLSVTGKVTFPDGTTQFVVMEEWDKERSFGVKQFPTGGFYKIELKAQGKSPTGREFSSELPVLEFDAEPLASAQVTEPEPEPEVTEPEVTEPEPEPKKEEPKQEEPVEEVVDEAVDEEIIEDEPEVIDEPQEEVAEESTGEPFNWTLWLSIGVVGNIILIVAGWFGWRMIRGKNKNSVDAMAQELFDDEDIDKELEEESE